MCGKRGGGLFFGKGMVFMCGSLIKSAKQKERDFGSIANGNSV